MTSSEMAKWRLIWFSNFIINIQQTRWLRKLHRFRMCCLECLDLVFSSAPLSFSKWISLSEVAVLMHPSIWQFSWIDTYQDTEIMLFYESMVKDYVYFSYSFIVKLLWLRSNQLKLSVKVWNKCSTAFLRNFL